MKYRIEILNT